MRSTHVSRSAAVIALLAAGCGSGSADPTETGEPAAGLTYFQNVKPIVDARCLSCHVEGGIGTFAMDDPKVVRDYAELIKLRVQDRTMPPWLAANGCADYAADRSLTDEQIDTIARWVDEGAAEGSPDRVGPPLSSDGELRLSRVDRTIAMAAEYTPALEPDDYRCFVIDWPETDVVFVSGFRANPGTPSVVHHVIPFLAGPDQAEEVAMLDDSEEGPGYTCFGGPLLDAPWLGGWAPGSPGSDYAVGTGIRVEPGSKVILQVHYNTLASGKKPDLTSVDFKLDREVEKEAIILPWANPQWLGEGGMPIPAASSDVTHSFTYDPTPFVFDGQPMTIHSASLHMHQLGKSGRLEIQRKDGAKECLLDVPRWNFHWQLAYPFEVPKVLLPGDKLSVECHWDNVTTDDAQWGEGTSDEMCLGGFYVSP
jgi:mono/diheme cytochrome c family protein